jgi:hypothetical protein
MRRRHFSRYRHLAPADQAHVRGGVVRRVEGARRDARGGAAREAGHATEAGGLEGLGRG